MPRFAQIPAFASMQSVLSGALATPSLSHSGDLIGMKAVADSIGKRLVSPRVLEQLNTLHGDSVAAVWEHGEALGAAMGGLSVNQAAHRSQAAQVRYLMQAPHLDDYLGAALRQVSFALHYAVTACTVHLPGGRPGVTRRRRTWRRRQAGRRNARP